MEVMLLPVSVLVGVCQSVYELDYVNKLSYVRMAAILDICYNILHITYFNRYLLSGASAFGLDGDMRSTECLSFAYLYSSL